MNALKPMLIAFSIFVAGFIVLYSMRPAAPPVTLPEISKLDSGSFGYEEKDGKILVAITNILNESSVYTLEYKNISKADALIILKSMQIDLMRATRPTP